MALIANFRSRNFIGRSSNEHFAELIPATPTTREAFDAIMREINDGGDPYIHATHFINAEKVSNFPNTENHHVGIPAELLDPIEPNKWMGAYELNLKEATSKDGEWLLGTGYGMQSAAHIDLLIAPSTRTWFRKGISPEHARFRFHPHSHALLLEGIHTVRLSGNGPTRTYSSNEAHVVHDGDMITIGDLSYEFRFTELSRSPDFTSSLKYLMRDILGHSTDPHPSLPTPSTHAHMISMGGYVFPLGAFACGAFGQVQGGYGDDGDPVAVKRFKSADEGACSRHEALMKKIGRHVSTIPRRVLPPEVTEVTPSRTPGVREMATNLKKHRALIVDEIGG